jgi:hypothetical protein
MPDVFDFDEAVAKAVAPRHVLLGNGFSRAYALLASSISMVKIVLYQRACGDTFCIFELARHPAGKVVGLESKATITSWPIWLNCRLT